MNASPWYMGVDFGANEDARNPADYHAGAVTDDAFYPGDIVQLLTGSPLMTVLDACAECGEVDVIFYDSELHILTLPEEALVHWDGDDE